MLSDHRSDPGIQSVRDWHRQAAFPLGPVADSIDTGLPPHGTFLTRPPALPRPCLGFTSHLDSLAAFYSIIANPISMDSLRRAWPLCLSGVFVYVQTSLSTITNRAISMNDH